MIRIIMNHLKQLIKTGRTVRLDINSFAYQMLRIKGASTSHILFRSTLRTSHRKMNIRTKQELKKTHKRIIHNPIALRM